MKNVSVVCDTCGRDLTATGNCDDYRLLVTSERIPSRGGAVTAMLVYPPVERSHHFCGINCLRQSTLIKGAS